MVEAQQSGRVVPLLDRSLGEPAETSTVNTLDRFEHRKLEVLDCKTRRVNEWEGHASSTSCSVMALLSNLFASASSFEATGLDVGNTPSVKLRRSPVKRYSIVGRTWLAL